MTKAEANLELAKFKAPRDFGLEKQERIRAVLTAFPGTPFDISVNTDPEAIELAGKIEDCLNAAGWKEVNATDQVGLSRGGNRPTWGIVVATGLSIEIDQKRWTELGKAEDALVGALRKEGLATNGVAIADGNTSNAIHVKVGKKP